jgi:hypothetical protein
MIDFFDQYELLLLLRLLTAHFVVDFIIQRDSWVEQKMKKTWTSPWLYVHGALAGIIAYLFAGYWVAIWLPFIIFVSHILLDGFKSKAKDTAIFFILDQAGHIIVIIVCWIILIKSDLLSFYNIVVSIISHERFWILTLSYILIIWPSGVWIGKITKPWRDEIKRIPSKKDLSEGDPAEEDSSEGLEKAGFWIGCLERILILTFALIGRFEAIGFLIAAKSIFRFGEIRSSNSRKEAEYILIGTMISFLIAVVVGLAANWLLKS